MREMIGAHAEVPHHRHLSRWRKRQYFGFRQAEIADSVEFAEVIKKIPVRLPKRRCKPPSVVGRKPGRHQRASPETQFAKSWNWPGGGSFAGKKTSHADGRQGQQERLLRGPPGFLVFF